LRTDFGSIGEQVLEPRLSLADLRSPNAADHRAKPCVEADVMKDAIKDRHFQQFGVQMAIAQLLPGLPLPTPWPRITLIVLALLIARFWA